MADVDIRRKGRDKFAAVRSATTGWDPGAPAVRPRDNPWTTQPVDSRRSAKPHSGDRGHRPAFDPFAKGMCLLRLSCGNNLYGSAIRTTVCSAAGSAMTTDPLRLSNTGK